MDLLPKNLESWIFLVVFCVIGFFIGQWIHNRRSKDMAGSDTINRMRSTRQRKRLSKKERLEARRLSK